MRNIARFCEALPLPVVILTFKAALAGFSQTFVRRHLARLQEEEQANLAKLAEAMVSEFDPPKDGPDAEESGIPSLYTYFGQFIDHDLTFDPSSTFQKQKDPKA